MVPKVICKTAVSQTGETLVETLVGLLIASLSLVMLAMAVSTGARIVISTGKNADTYSRLTEELATITGPFEPISSIMIESNDVYGSQGVSISDDDADRIVSVKVDLPGEKTVVSYQAKRLGTSSTP